MAQFAIARAARLLGIKRCELQQMIRQGHLSSQNGMVDYDELSACYPGLQLTQESGANERAKLIRATAFGRRVRDTVAPEAGELEVRLKQKETELSISREQARQMQTLLKELLQQLGQWQLNATPEQRQMLQELNRWLGQRMG
ncbi:hypothetical protein D5085_15595 [Ectothiorhodospiraceae bacterium BW-2]|nr:hypothetical protein D5085_15595 [Ectothiorhodospiraceae bacterium BW-2]